jgi:tRNA(fMet)-specific endonuclease VapC
VACLIDTSVLVAGERGTLVLERVLVDTEQYAISVVSAAELLHGVHRATGRRADTRAAYVEGLFSKFELVPIDLPVSRAYARASSALARAGTPVDANDLWISATAIANGFEVLALDGDFDRIPGVRRTIL